MEPPSSPARRAILDATESLLGTTRLHDLSVSAILADAGVSRPTFYSYFPSKYAVVAELLRDVFGEVFRTVQPWLSADGQQRPEQTLRTILRDAASLLHEHGSVIRAAHENAQTDRTIGQEWFSIMQRFRDALRTELIAVRARTSRSEATDVDLLASTLIWSSERVFYLSTLGIDPSLHGSDDAVEGLMSIWVPAIYGIPYTPPTDRTHAR
jgi:AcrR family transcriptional regulator